MHQCIPDHSESLYVDDETTLSDVLAFVYSRVECPAVVGQATVYNFHNRSLDAEALVNANLAEGSYVVPYQVPGVWGFVVEVLPVEMASAPVLAYRREEEQYQVHPNFRTADIDTAALRATLDEMGGVADV